MKSDLLGRSITDLMDENDLSIEQKEQVLEININEIQPNPEQPRTTFPNETINELRDSILEHGVIQPVILKSATNGYILIAGERRVRAAKKAGLKTIPAIVRDYNSKYLAELALLENLQREDLSPIEEAMALSKMIEMSNLTHDELAKKIGKSRSYVTNMIGLLNLPTIIIKDLTEGKISMGHARVLSKISDIDLLLELRNDIIENELNVRDLEKAAKISKQGTSKKDNTSKKYSWVKSYKKDFDDILKGKLKYTLSNTSIKINYKNEQELQKILEMLKNENHE